MKKFSSFLNRLKPYKRLYKIFWMVFVIVCMLIFQMLMLVFAHFVPHTKSAFYYWFNGLHALLIDSRIEPDAAQGFIFASTVLGFIPIICIIPFLYFVTTNWFIQEKLSDKFVEVPRDKYMKWATFIHFSILASTFLLIPGLLSYIGGGGLLPHHTARAITGAFTNNFGKRIAGIAAFLYFGVGCVFGVIVTFWGLGMLIGWVCNKIGEFFAKWKAQRLEAKQTRMDVKRASKVDSIDKKVNARQGTDTTRFDTTDDF